MEPTNYPLHWPVRQPRTPRHQVANSRFKAHSVYTTVDLIESEVARLGGRHLIISTNMRVKANGTPYSNDKPPEDRGAAIYFDLDKKPIAMACDRWNRVADNLHAIAKHIEALRGQERWGVGSMAQAFAGYAALPEHASTRRAWWEVLDVPMMSSIDEIRDAYRRRARSNHPDAGGSAEAMAEINAAWAEAQEARR